MVYAVIDTNVFVAALLTRNNDSATVKIYEAIADGLITPLYHKDMKERREAGFHNAGNTSERILLARKKVL